ncbi:hypothetical protein A2U01_0116703, partial [Trifolium medium]|nr:hypothetical protein [Trifolium medium]
SPGPGALRSTLARCATLLLPFAHCAGIPARCAGVSRPEVPELTFR